MSHFRNAICHASGMQSVTLQECNLSRFRNAICHALGMQFAHFRNAICHFRNAICHALGVKLCTRYCSQHTIDIGESVCTCSDCCRTWVLLQVAHIK